MQRGKGNSKNYIIYDSNEDIWHKNVFSLAAFCKEHSLNESCMRDVVKGRQTYQHKGFYCQEDMEDSVKTILHNVNKKKFKDLSARFNKLSKPLDKDIRYKRNNSYIDFLNNVENHYQKYYVEQKKSCKKISDIVNVSNETIRKAFKLNELKRYGNYEMTSSKGEEELRSFLTELTKENFLNNRSLITPLEIDCYSEKYRVGFEYCGLFWHSELYKKNYYHKKKLESCKSKNIRLLTIFENEWVKRNSQVKGFIKSTLGIFDRRIYARDCVFKECDKQNEFFDQYHIQGNPYTANRYFGLYYNNELVGCVSYGLHHRDSELYCLNRLAFKGGVQIIGGSSKLIKNSIDNIYHKEIVTWSDNRWSTGKIYEDCGFVKDCNLFPDYIYFNKNTKETKSKQSMKKSKICCPSNKTEHEWALENGWVRIYDCGKIRWKYIKE
jgi:hypothetical protein